MRPCSLTPLVLLVVAALACSPLSVPRPAATPRPTGTLVPSPTRPPTAAPTQRSTPTAVPTLAASPTSSASPNAGPIPLKIISDLPMTGAALALTQGILNGEVLRMDQAKNQACGGRYTLALESWDDSSAASGTWDAAAEADNANRAAADPSIIAYLGPFNSGAAKISIPILDQNGPLVMISPGNTYPGLTKPGQGVAGEPDKYYPAGVRNYARVVSADDVQGAVAARFVHNQLGAKTVYLLDDHELYGQLTADAFEAAAKGLGLTVVGRKSFDAPTENFTTLMNLIATSNHGGPPDAIYAGMIVDNGGADLLKAKVAAMGDNTKVKFIGPDGLEVQSLIDDAGASVAEGVYATLGGLPNAQLPPAGQKFYADLAARYGAAAADNAFAIYGYEAMNAALKAIEDVCAAGGDPTDRRAVRDAVFALKDFQGALGTWSFDANGDTSLTDITFYQAIQGSFQVVAASVADKITAVK